MVNYVSWEWVAAFLSISAAFCMAIKRYHLLLILPWIFWFLSSLIFGFIFFTNNQNGMLFGQIIGLITSSLGFYQWFQPQESKHNKTIANITVWAVIVFGIHAIYRLLEGFLIPSINNLEWISSSFGITASLLMASRSKFSFGAWFLWSVSNSVAAYTSYYNNQMGFFTVQCVYMLMNIIGCYKWTKDFFNNRA
jgi:hypothetical protein